MEQKAKIIGIEDLFRESWNLYRERFGVLTKITLLPVLLIAAGDILQLSASLKVVGAFFIFFGVVSSLIAVLALIFGIKETDNFAESYTLVFRNFFPYLWLGLLSFFIPLGGFFMFIVPGIIFSIWFIFVVYLFALEKEKGLSAFLKSRDYVRGHWWQIFGRQLVLVFIALAFVFLISFIAGLFISNKGAENLVGDLLTIFIAPFVTVYFYVLYQNLKSLKPEVVSKPASGPRGFFIFSGILGVIGLILLIFLFAIIVGLSGSAETSSPPPYFFQ